MKLEKGKLEDAAEMAKWMIANLVENNASLESLKSCTFFKIAGILYLPVQPVLLLESLAPNPEVKGAKRLLAIRRAMDDLRKLYPRTTFLFLTKGNTGLDEAARYYGFREMDFKVYRMQPNDRSTAAKKYRGKVASEVVLRHHTRTVGRV